MGCICSKGSRDDSRVKGLRKSSKRLIASSRKEDVVLEADGVTNDATARLMPTQPTDKNAGFTPAAWGRAEKNATVLEKPTGPQIKGCVKMDSGLSGGPLMSRVFSVKNGVDGAQVVAGWPSWLTAVAGEAINGWLPRKADSFEKLDKIGQGTYSSVYRARDLETGKVVAMKKVRFVNMDPESVRFMAREILILRRLDHPNVMRLEGLVTSRVSGNLYLVFEYMEHDLAGLAALPTIKFTESQIKCYMQQLLRGLEHCHGRGVLHRDIKGSNLLIDRNGNLKIGDFGLATFFCNNQKQPLTSRVVTLWYRPPELLLGATDYGAAVDLWSAGCILAELLAGKPIMPGRTEVEQLHKIFKLCGSPSEEYWRKSKLPHSTIFKPQQPYKRCVAETFKDFPPAGLALLDSLLAVEPEGRGSVTSALQSEFFTTKPFPCDPASLPKYPPSKELDIKLRNEEARRQRETGGQGLGIESYRKGSRKSKAVPAPDANAELQSSIQKWHAQAKTKINSEDYNPEEDGGTGFPIEPARSSLQNGLIDGQPMQLGALMNRIFVKEVGAPTCSQRGYDSSRNGAELRTQRSYRPRGIATQLSRFSNSVAASGSSRFDLCRDSSVHSHWPENYQISDSESSHHLLGRPNFTYKKDQRAPEKESIKGYASKKNWIHYSGPLLPSGGNIEEMLKEHEKQIQDAVRKARVDKTEVKNAHGNNGQTEVLLHNVKNGW